MEIHICSSLLSSEIRHQFALLGPAAIYLHLPHRKFPVYTYTLLERSPTRDFSSPQLPQPLTRISHANVDREFVARHANHGGTRVSRLMVADSIQAEHSAHSSRIIWGSSYIHFHVPSHCCSPLRFSGLADALSFHRIPRRASIRPSPLMQCRYLAPSLSFSPPGISSLPGVTPISLSQTRGYSFAVVYRIMQQTTGPPVVNRVQRHSEYRQLPPSMLSFSVSVSPSLIRSRFPSVLD